MLNFDTSHLTGKQADGAARAQAILSQAAAENRDVTKDEKAELKEIVAEFDGLAETTGLVDRLAAATQSLGRKTEPDPMPGQAGTAPRAGTLGGRPAEDTTAWPQAARDRSWLGMFGAAARDTSGWRSAAEFLEVIASGRHDPRLQVSAAANESEGGAGGYLVPQPVAAPFMDRFLQRSIVRPRARNFAMSSSSIRVPGLDWLDMSDPNKIATLGLEWLPELGEGSQQRPKIRSQTLTAHRAAIYSQASLELVSDAPTFVQVLLEGFAAATARGLDYSYLWGNGVGRPLGVFNSPCLVTVDAESAQVGDTLVYQNAVNMYARMLPSSVNSAVWLAHPSCVPSMLTFNIPGGSMVGSTVTPAITMNSDGSFVLMGRPVVISDLMKPLGDSGDFAFVDFDFYGVGFRKEIGIERNLAPGWATYAEDYRLILRTDGQSLLQAAVTPPWSAAPLSPFVTLASRA